MTLGQLAIVILAQTAQVLGQLVLKRGMTRRGSRIARIALGIIPLVFWFFAWLKLLAGLDISYLYPFEGISLVLLVFAAQILLHERTEARTWIGVAMITSGMIFVGMSSA